MVRGVILDVDGTVVRGDDPIPGAKAGLDLLDDRGLRRLFVSNNPTKPPAAYESRLARAGFDISADEIVTAATVTTAYLRDNYGDAPHFLVGEDGLRTLMTDAGLTLTSDPADARVLVASIDRDFDYDRLAVAMRVLQDDSVAFVGTDPDMVIPAAAGDIPGSGAVIHAIAGVAGRDPDIVLGKPSHPTQDLVRSRIGLDPADCLVVGDRLDTDIALGARAGMTTALVTTGIAETPALVDAPVEPDYVLDSLAELADLDELS
jgi:4-nitrophenyl phosphatase